jgi:hypothetical protein
LAAVLTPATTARANAFGALGGALAGLAWLAVATLLAVAVAGQAPLAVANAVGAWLVRWLQTAAPPALAGFYPDATLGGLALVLAVGALGGALLAGLVLRLDHEGPLAWALVGAVAAWLLLRWALGAVDPLLLRVLGSAGLAAGCAAWALVSAAWLAAGRRVGPWP